MWFYYFALKNKFAKILLPPDSLDMNAAYQVFCNIIKKVVKRLSHADIKTTIFHVGMQSVNPSNNVSQSPEGHELSLAATALLARLDRKPRN